jgi:acyl-CoA synthetase (AMP-forming)/AMP-acid ligase II
VLPPELLNRLEKELPWVRPGLGIGYGTTETNGHGVNLSPGATYSNPDSIGKPAPTVRVEIRDPVTRNPLSDGEVGEIALRTPAAFVGYWNNVEATAACLDDERWYHTGDFGHVRDGYVYLEGRRHDLIIRGGENVYPVEIENRIFEHPEITEVAVVGVDHPTLGQEVRAYAVRRSGSVVSEADIVRWCAEVLAPFKVPSQVEFLAELPHNATGKVVKHELGRPKAQSDFIQD